MFEYYAGPERPKIRVPGGWAAAAFAVSLAVHAGAVAWMAGSRVTIKILRTAAEVRDVLLVPKLPAEKLTLPRAVGRNAPQPTGSEIEGAPTDIEAGPGRATGPPDAGPGPRTTSTAKVPMVKREGTGPPPSPLPEIRLHLGSASDARGASDFVLVLPPPGARGAAGPLPPRAGDREVADLLAYLYPEIPGGGGGFRGAGRGRAGAAGRPSRGATGGAVLSVKDPALIAWAGAALSLIMTRWNLPDGVRTTERIRVEITAVILSSGDVTSFHILSSSRNIPFDQAALEALRASAPFPAFPESLPYSSIEIRFLFENND
jgi:TonB family protein